jgi:hypothetical protein
VARTRDEIDYCERCTAGASSYECPRRYQRQLRLPEGITVSVDPLAHDDGRPGTALRKRLPGRIVINERLRRAGNQVHAGECRQDQRGRLIPRARDIGMAKTESERQISACRSSTDRGPSGPQRYTETPTVHRWTSSTKNFSYAAKHCGSKRGKYS